MDFPHLTIIARARNRRHAHKLMDIGVTHIFRETLLSSLAMSEDVLTVLGQSPEEAKHVIDSFGERDSELLIEQHEFHDSEEHLIQSSLDTAAELEALERRLVEARFGFFVIRSEDGRDGQCDKHCAEIQAFHGDPFMFLFFFID